MCVALKSNLYHLNESKSPPVAFEKPHINSPAATFVFPHHLSRAPVASWAVDVAPSAGFPSSHWPLARREAEVLVGESHNSVAGSLITVNQNREDEAAIF